MVVKWQENLAGLSGLVNGEKMSLGYFLTKFEKYDKISVGWLMVKKSHCAGKTARKSHWAGKIAIKSHWAGKVVRISHWASKIVRISHWAG